MSATNRGAERRPDDYYVTPKWAVVNFLEAFFKAEPAFFLPLISDWHKHSKIVLDPCAGGDKENGMAYPEVMKLFGIKDVVTMDVRSDSKADIVASFLEYKFDYNFDLIISNPPFSLLLEFMEHGMNKLNDGGFLTYLTRLSALASKKRKDFWEANKPKYMFIYASKRPSFFVNGKTDSAEYCHFVWQQGYRGDTAIIWL